jgi:predicted PurR-regulated permease PerM
MHGRGVDAPMPVILVGALGGMATGGIIGMFVGATLPALAWQVVTGLGRREPRRKHLARRLMPCSAVQVPSRSCGRI